MADVERIRAILDPAERAREIGRVLNELSPVTTELRVMRQAAVMEMRATMSYGEIATALGIARGTVQQIAEGRTRGGRPTRKLEEPST